MSKITQKIRVALKSVLSLQLGEIETDKGVLIFDGETLEVGAEVFTKDENDEVIAAADGEYVADGKTVKVEEGKVTEITEKEEKKEEKKEETEESEEMAAFKSQMTVLSMSYNEIFRAIADAVHESGEEYAYVQDAGDDFAIVDIYTEGEGDKLYKYAYTMDENGNITLGERTEVRIKSEYVPVDETEKDEKEVEKDEAMAAMEPAADPADEKDENEKEKTEDKTVEEKVDENANEINIIKDAITTLTNSIVALEKRLADVEGKLAKVEAEPASEPAEDSTVEEKETKTRMSYLRKQK